VVRKNNNRRATFKQLSLYAGSGKKAQNLQLANLNPSLLLEGKTPGLIDEWQLAPKLWDAVRFEVDR